MSLHASESVQEEMSIHPMGLMPIGVASLLFMRTLEMTTIDSEREQHESFNVYEHLSDQELEELNNWLDHVDALNDEIERERCCINEYLMHH